MNIILPENVVLILDRLKKYGSIGYVVGGCVRDSIIGLQPNDWDITTPLLPGVVKNLFSDYHVIDTGIKHGTVTVVIDDEQYEITTFRIDGKYSDNRHPDNVHFTDRLEEDLKRRDFTINAMAYNPDVGLIDKFGGMDDLMCARIRCVGNPKERFEEDGLRILRALRFAITLGFNINHDTNLCLKQSTNLLRNVSKERINSELCKMLSTKFPLSFEILREHMNLFYYLTSYFDDNVESSAQKLNHFETVNTLITSGKNDGLAVRMALLYQFVDGDLKSIMSYNRVDNQTIKSVIDILSHSYDYVYVRNDDASIKYHTRKFISQIGYDGIYNLVKFWNARIPVVETPIFRYKYLDIAEKIDRYAHEFEENSECCSLKQLDITGDDLIEIGYKPGVKIGETLNYLLDEVMHDPYKNKRNWLIEWAKERLTNDKYQ